MVEGLAFCALGSISIAAAAFFDDDTITLWWLPNSKPRLSRSICLIAGLLFLAYGAVRIMQSLT